MTKSTEENRLPRSPERKPLCYTFGNHMHWVDTNLGFARGSLAWGYAPPSFLAHSLPTSLHPNVGIRSMTSSTRARARST